MLYYYLCCYLIHYVLLLYRLGGWRAGKEDIDYIDKYFAKCVLLALLFSKIVSHGEFCLFFTVLEQLRMVFKLNFIKEIENSKET